MNLVTAFAQRLKVLVSVVVAVLVFVVHDQKPRRSAPLARLLFLAPVGLNSTSPGGIGLADAEHTPALARLNEPEAPTGARARRLRLDPAGRDGKLRTALFARGRQTGAIPTTGFLAVSAISAPNGAELSLATGELSAAGARHLLSMPPQLVGVDD